MPHVAFPLLKSQILTMHTKVSSIVISVQISVQVAQCVRARGTCCIQSSSSFLSYIPFSMLAKSLGGMNEVHITTLLELIEFTPLFTKRSSLVGNKKSLLTLQLPILVALTCLVMISSSKSNSWANTQRRRAIHGSLLYFIPERTDLKSCKYKGIAHEEQIKHSSKAK